MIAESIEVTPKITIDKVCKNFKKVWIECNWLRLLLLRIKRILIGIGDVFEVLTAKSKVFSGIVTGFGALYKVLGHLGYIVYGLRMFFYTAPCLISAASKKGWEGFKKVWQRESQSISNDVVWATVGLLTTFLFQATFVSTMIVVGLYLFDVANVLYHGNKKKRELKQKNKEICLKMFVIESQLGFEFFNGVIDKMNNIDIQDKIASTPDSMKKSARLSFARELLKKSEVKITEHQEDLCVDLLAEFDQTKTLGEGNAEKMKAASIEGLVLLLGMVLSGVGTAAFVMASSIGVAGTTSIGSLIAGSAAVATASLVLGPVAILGLAIVAIGASVVMGMCIYRLVRKIKMQKEAKRRDARVSVAAPEGVGIFSPAQSEEDSTATQVGGNMA